MIIWSWDPYPSGDFGVGDQNDIGELEFGNGWGDDGTTSTGANGHGHGGARDDGRDYGGRFDGYGRGDGEISHEAVVELASGVITSWVAGRS